MCPEEKEMILLRGVIILVYAAISAAEDMKYRKISRKKAALFCGIGLLLCIFGRRSVPEIIQAGVPGLLLFLLSYFSGGCIGMGDAVFLLVCGLYLEKEGVAAAAGAAFVCCAAAALGIVAAGMICGRTYRHSKRGLPYIAFLFIPILAAVVHLWVTGYG